VSGHKKIMRLSIGDKSEASIREKMTRLGLFCFRSDYRQKPSYTSSLGDVYTELVPFRENNDFNYTLMVSTTLELAREAIYLEDNSENLEKLSSMLGYPDCCIRSYEKIGPTTDWLQILLENSKPNNMYPYQANKLSYLFSGQTFFYDYFPCSLHCEGTINISKEMSKMMLNNGLTHYADNIKSAMLDPILILDGILIQLVDCSIHNNYCELNYDLSHSKRWLWRLHKGIENHFFWNSNTLKRGDGMLECYQDEKYLGSIEQSQTQRLLVFR